MSKKILIAEDDRSLASSLGRALQSDGYECHYTTDGVATVTQAKEIKPDLIVLDLLLPKKDGRTVLREIKASSISEVSVLSISGVFRGRSTAEELRDLGADEFLEKPFTVRTLLDKVLELIGPSQEPEGEEAKIRLTDETPAAILWRTMNSGFNGAVQFQRDKVHKVIVLKDGQPALIRSNSAKECLGRRLLAAGRIDRKALDESLRRSRDDGMRQGEVFVDLGLMTTEEVDAELEAQCADKLLGVFNWEHGESWTQSGVNSLSHASPIEGWSPRALILYGAQRMTMTQVNRSLNGLGDGALHRVEADLDEKALRAPGVTEFLNVLEPGAVLSEHLAKHGRAIYGLRLVGALTIGDKSDASDAAAPSDPKVAELQNLRQEMQTQTFFQILGVDEETKPAAIRSAFLKNAKSYHPDKFSSASEAVRKAAGEVFTLMSSAHDTLTDKDARREYDDRLKRGASTGKDNEEVVGILRAESLFRDAEAFVKRRDYTEAASRLSDALELNPNEGEFHALLGWCHYLQNQSTESEVRKAIGYLERSIQLAPSSATGYYYLAKLHKACEKPAEAQKMFRKVVEIDPKHQEAMREIRLASMRKGKKGSSGLFGFGRKK